MSLSAVDIGQLGGFVPSARATFRIDTPNLPDNWEYIYQNRRVLLKVDQFGPVYAQANPPSDVVLFRREPAQRWSSWLVWVVPEASGQRPFNNFFRPAPWGESPSALPEDYELVYSPSCATWKVRSGGLLCTTRLLVPLDETAVVMEFSVENASGTPISTRVIPAMRPYANPAMLAPWDKPEWYLKTHFIDAPATGFVTRLLNMNSEPEKRRTVVMLSEGAGVKAAELSLGHFIGGGTFDNPEAIEGKGLRLPMRRASSWEDVEQAETIYGYPPVWALQYDVKLRPGQREAIRQVVAMLQPEDDGSFPGPGEAAGLSRLLDDEAIGKELARLDERYSGIADARCIETPDKALDEYVNDWLPLQLDWTCSLDRGWPSGMRGSRDSANDFTAMVPLDAPWCRRILQTMFSCQRSDGWFPRQYSALGREGKHDMRGHVDAGCWVVELLYNYLCFSKDFDFVTGTLPWLDSAETASVLDHALRGLDFFIRDENLGEHGLCKIGEGDWLDSVNRAGLKGRGETVSVTSQAIIAMVQMTLVVERLKELGLIEAKRADALTGLYATKQEQFIKALREHAYNADGYFNSVFNDDGRWIFSNNDPDGKRRVYGPANWFALSAGVAFPDLIPSVLKELEFLRCDDGYRVLWPPFGAVPIPHVGRGGSGDQPPGLFENGNAYNQGSHGFLGRALAVAGEGDRLYEVIHCLLPFDQQRHPVGEVKTPPYAVVNCWQNIPNFERHGGMQFLTGSIAYGMRMVYEWMLGIKPLPGGLAIDPCVPSGFRSLSARFTYLSKELRLLVKNPDRRQCCVTRMTLNGSDVTGLYSDPLSHRTFFVADDALFTQPVNDIEVCL